MKNLLLVIAFTATLANNAEAQQTADSRIADLVQSGKVRVALHLAQYTKDPVSGELRGLGSGTVIVQVAQALGARLGVAVELVGYPTPPAVEECLRIGACDVGFGGIERATVVGVSPPFLQLDYTYLVPVGSSIRSVADADQPGVRIAVVTNHLSTLALNRILQHVKPIGTDIPETSFDLLRTGQADAFASTRPVLLAYSPKLAGSR